MRRRLLALLLAGGLVLGLGPLTVHADEVPDAATEEAFSEEFAQEPLQEGIEEPLLQAQDDAAPYALTYSFDADAKTATVTGLTGTAQGSLIIPETVEHEGETYTVTAVGAGAFQDKTGFTGTLTLPATLTSVGASAFSGCENLTGDLVLPAGLTSLGAYAFSDLRRIEADITIPAGITTIPDYCFYMDGYSRTSSEHGLTGIAFAAGSQLESIGAYAFAGNWEVTGGIDIPDTVTSIGAYAFHDTHSTSESTYLRGAQGTLSLPSGIQSIGEGAFYLCDFSGDLVIPASVESIGDKAFQHAGFTGALMLPEGLVSISNWCFAECGFKGMLQLPASLKTIGYDAFWRCYYLDPNLTIPEGVAEIGSDAFSKYADKASGFGTLSLPSTLKTIGSSAFFDCVHFNGALVVPDSVESIGSRAFNGCRYFTSLRLPDNANFTTIEEGTFGSVWNYQMGFTGELVIPDSVTSIGKEAFELCGKFTGELRLPSGITSIGDAAFQQCTGFTGTLSLPSGLKSIGEEAFLWCSGLTGLFIPDGVETIGDEAFFGCEAMSGELAIPGSVQTIGDTAFGQFGAKSAGGVALAISEGVTTIDDNAFCNAGFTGSAAIPASVTTLGDSVFSGCTRLTGYSLPDSLTSVPSGMFAGCSSLAGSLVLPSSAASIGSRAFSGCAGLTGDLVIPAAVTSVGYSAFKDCAGLDGTLTLPSGLSTIGYEAFRNCSGLTGSLSLPASLTSLGYATFNGCQGLTGDVTIPSGITKLENVLFSGCSGLTGTLTIPAGAAAQDSYSVPFRNTYFSTIVNNSASTFSAVDMMAEGVCDYYVDEAGAKVTDIATGTYTRTANASPVDISSATVTGIEDYYVLTGSYIEPKPTVTLGGTVLAKDEQYTLSYSNNRYRGTATVIVKGYAYNGYVGTVTKTFQIVRADEVPTEPTIVSIKDATITGIANKTYTGKALAQTPVVKVGDVTLKAGTDYKLTYKNNKDVGTATVAITGIGDYTDSVTKSFKITQATNTATVAKTSVKKTVKLAAAKKAAQKVALPKVTAKFGTAKWKVATKDKKKVLSLKNGKVVVKKGAKKGTYVIKLRATVAATKNYKAAQTKVVTVKVVVK